MKKIVIAAVVALACLLVAPKFIGSIVETEREKSVVELNKTDGITLTTNNYVPRWFGATVTSEITITLEEAGLADIRVLVEEDLSFGPVMITDQGLHFGLGYSAMTFKLLSPEVDEKVIAMLNENLHAGALLGFNKAITTFIQTEKITHEEQDTSLISYPLKGQFTLTDNTYISGKLSWGGLELNETDQRLVIGKVTMSTEQEVVSGDYLQGTAILIGDIKLKTEKINVLKHGSPVFTLNDGQLTSEVSLADGLLKLLMAYNAESIMVSGQRFTKANLAIVFNNLDHQALQELNTAMDDLSSSANQINSEDVLVVLSDAFDKVLAKDPSLQIDDLSVVTEQGKIASKFNFTINKDLLDLSNLNSMTLIMALEADAKGSVPVGFLTQFGVEPMVHNFVEQGYLTKQDNNVLFDAKYSKSLLTLNGKALQM